MSRKAKNRKTGELQEDVQTIVIMPPACPTCGSTRRGKMHATSRLETTGEMNGVAYDVVIWRRTNCLDCGQRYIVKSYEAQAKEFA